MTNINTVNQNIDGLIAIHNKNTNRLYRSTVQQITGTIIEMIFKQVYVYNFDTKEYIQIEEKEYKNFLEQEYEDFILNIDITKNTINQQLEKYGFEQICPNMENWINKH